MSLPAVKMGFLSSDANTTPETFGSDSSAVRFSLSAVQSSRVMELTGSEPSHRIAYRLPPARGASASRRERRGKTRGGRAGHRPRNNGESRGFLRNGGYGRGIRRVLPIDDRRDDRGTARKSVERRVARTTERPPASSSELTHPLVFFVSPQSEGGLSDFYAFTLFSRARSPARAASLLRQSRHLERPSRAWFETRTPGAHTSRLRSASRWAH